MEAAAARTALITTDTLGCREIVVQNRSGYLVPVRDSEALTKAIGLLLESPDLRLMLARKASEIVESKFDLSLVVKSYANIYNKLLVKAIML